MDLQVNYNMNPEDAHCHQSYHCVSSTDINNSRCNSICSSNYVFNTNDHTTLIPTCAMKNKKYDCQNPHSDAKELSKPNTQITLLWITIIHIFCLATLALLSIYMVSNILIFEKKSKEMDDTLWRLEHHDYSTNTSQISSTTEPPHSKDKCEPLYFLIYAHCFVWFLFLILDHVARHMHQKRLRSRGHLRAFDYLSRLAAFPFQLVSLWTVLLAIFITLYAQQDKADMEPYCDANLLISPKNGIAVLLVIEFICVTISSLIYANSLRKFNLEKPAPDVCGWEENSYVDRWTPGILQTDVTTINQQPNSEHYSNYEQHETTCLLDLLEYYSHANQELSASLGRVSKKLLDVENKSQEPSES